MVAICWPLVLFISLAVVHVSSEGEGACIVDWFILNAMRAGGPWFTACSLPPKCILLGDSLEEVHDPCLWLSGSCAKATQEQRERRSHKKATGAKNGTIVFLDQQESGFKE